MTEKLQKPNKDRVFLIEDILPEASSFFEDEPAGLENAIKDANIILDTNVLLIPYGAGQNSLTQIVRVYNELKKEGRLYIPAQVAREFVKNRPNKLAQLYQGISDKISQLKTIDKFSYPILESVAEFNELNSTISEIHELKRKLKVGAEKVRQQIKDWGWNDPVTQAYRPVFTKEVVVSPEIDRDSTLAEMLQRYEHSIPPGYKDASKPDAGIGDYLIWKTILHIGKQSNRSIIFISGDEKADWLHGAEGSGFLPRYELQAEFRRASNGKDFYIIPLSRLLELQEAGTSTVAEVKSEEVRVRTSSFAVANCPKCDDLGEYEISESIGSTSHPHCLSCGTRFHLHRTKNGIVTRPYEQQSRTPDPISREKTVEIISCPDCGEENIKELGISPNSTAWCICDQCTKKFPIHRRLDGSSYVNSNYNG